MDPKVLSMLPAAAWGAAPYHVRRKKGLGLKECKERLLGAPGLQQVALQKRSVICSKFPYVITGQTVPQGENFGEIAPFMTNHAVCCLKAALITPTILHSRVLSKFQESAVCMAFSQAPL